MLCPHLSRCLFPLFIFHPLSFHLFVLRPLSFLCILLTLFLHLSLSLSAPLIRFGSTPRSEKNIGGIASFWCLVRGSESKSERGRDRVLISISQTRFTTPVQSGEIQWLIAWVWGMAWTADIDPRSENISKILIKKSYRKRKYQCHKNMHFICKLVHVTVFLGCSPNGK